MKQPSVIPKIIPEEGVTFTDSAGRRIRLFPNGSMIDEATGRVLKGIAPEGQQSEVALRSASNFNHAPTHTVAATAKKLVSYEILCRAVEIQNDDGNNPVYIGGKGVSTSVYGYKLNGGESKTYDVSDPSIIYLVGTAGETVRVSYLQ